MITRFCALLLVLVHVLGCSSGTTPRIVTLPSGRTVKVLGVGPIRFSSGETGLILTYQTDLKVSDQDALRKEVDEIWRSFQIDAEKANVRSAIITASEVPEGMIIKRSHEYNFVFQKSDDGTWQNLNNKKAQPAGQPGS